MVHSRPARQLDLSFRNLLLGFVTCGVSVSCAPAEETSQPREQDPVPYCSTVSNYENPITVTGAAKYEYRIEGNGVIPNGSNAFAPQSGAPNDPYSLTINGVQVTYACGNPCTSSDVVTGLKNIINNLSAVRFTVRATGTRVLGLNHRSGGAVTVTNLQRLTSSGGPRPIRFAEVRVSDSNGGIVQCSETDGSGNFSLQLPPDGANYTVSVATRASNSKNSAYILNNPTGNQHYLLSGTVTASGSPSLNLVASAASSGDMLGGAFNILDQILISQEYLRTTTADCNVSNQPNYFSGCVPFTVAPLVRVYWAKGVSPGVYYGITGGISFYLNDQRKLFILGGVNGNVTTQDMDHFDNSVIIHEYGHFIEDQYADPNSPGGSHNGNSIIDARLAWGEGFANFFQAAVTGEPYYRDTSGTVDCTTSSTMTCSGSNFDEYLDPSAGPYSDEPDSYQGPGEGNFREFSIARLLWDVIKPGSTTQFSEIWRALNGQTNSMRVANDPFKSIGRFHEIQRTTAGVQDWSSYRTAESQADGLQVYGTSLSLGGGCNIAMNIYVSSRDDGSFSRSDHFRNNDFYSYYHTGGAFNASINWWGSDIADLDLYIYRAGYTYGAKSTMATYNDVESVASTGSAAVSANLPAGFYMINVMAYTGLYHGLGTYNSTYSLSVNGQPACPNP